jgi:hypothetical protein
VIEKFLVIALFTLLSGAGDAQEFQYVQWVVAGVQP